MGKETVRIRLDLPKKLYHESRAVVEKRRAQGDPEIKSLSDLIVVALERYMGEQG